MKAGDCGIVNSGTKMALIKDAATTICSAGSEMKSIGIREAKAHLSRLVRAAANGEPTLITDYGKPIAVISSVEERKAAPTAVFSDAAKFKQVLLACPDHFEIDF